MAFWHLMIYRFIVFRTYGLHYFNPFKFVETCSMAYTWSTYTNVPRTLENKVYLRVVKWSGLFNAHYVKLINWVVPILWSLNLFSGLLFLVINENMLMSFIMIVDWDISLVGVHFYFMYSKVFYWSIPNLKLFFLVNLIIYHFDISLFLTMLLWSNKSIHWLLLSVSGTELWKSLEFYQW